MPLRLRGLDDGLRSGVKNLIHRFENVTPVELSHRVFDSVKYHRNNKFYEFIIGVCRLIYENTLLAEDSGQYRFVDFTRDERKMNVLFEEFLRNFYRIEQTEYRVGGEDIYWQFECVGESRGLLPKMQKDITLVGARRKIIIDAKYYRDPIVTNYGASKLHSANLYQMFAYMRNQ